MLITNANFNVNHPQIPSILHNELIPQDFFKQHTACSCNHYLDSLKCITGRPSHDWNSGDCSSTPPRLDLPQTSGKTGKKKAFSSGCEACPHLSLETDKISFWQAHPSTLPSPISPEVRSRFTHWNDVAFFSALQRIFFRMLWPLTGTGNLFGVSAQIADNFWRHAFTCGNLGLLQSYFQIFQ
jgi:hypothetical protein